MPDATTPYSTLRSPQDLLNLSNAAVQGMQNRYQYTPGTYNAPAMNATFTPGSAATYQQGGYTPMQQAGTFGQQGNVGYTAPNYTAAPSIGTFGQQGNVGGTIGGLSQTGVGTGMQGAANALSSFGSTPVNAGYGTQAQGNINQMQAMGADQGNFQSGYGWQGQNLLQQGLNNTGQDYSGMLNRAGAIGNQAQARAETPFESRTTDDLRNLQAQANARSAQGFGYDDPLVALQSQLAQDAQTQPGLPGTYQPLQNQLIQSAISGLQRGGGLSGQEFEQSLQTPISILQRQQQRALENLRDQMAAEGAYNTGRFQEFAARDIIEPYGNQIQNLVNEAYAANLGNRTTDEVARQQVANQILGQAFGTEAGEAQLGLQGLQTRAGVGQSLAEQALGADEATRARIAQTLGISQADLQRELAQENVSQQRLQQAMDALGLRGDLTAQMGNETRANLGQAFDILQGNRGQELAVENVNQARNAQELAALEAAQSGMQGQQGVNLAANQQQGQNLMNALQGAGMTADTYNQFMQQGLANQEGRRADYTTNLAGQELAGQMGLEWNQLSQQDQQFLSNLGLQNQESTRADYTTGLQGLAQNNQSNLAANQLTQADRQFGTNTALQNRGMNQQDTMTQLAIDQLRQQGALQGFQANQGAQQAAADQGLQAVMAALGMVGQEYGQYNTQMQQQLQNEQFMANLANQLAMMGIYGQSGAGGTNININPNVPAGLGPTAGGTTPRNDQLRELEANNQAIQTNQNLPAPVQSVGTQNAPLAGNMDAIQRALAGNMTPQELANLFNQPGTQAGTTAGDYMDVSQFTPQGMPQDFWSNPYIYIRQNPAYADMLTPDQLSLLGTDKADVLRTAREMQGYGG